MLQAIVRQYAASGGRRRRRDEGAARQGQQHMPLVGQTYRRLRCRSCHGCVDPRPHRASVRYGHWRSIRPVQRPALLNRSQRRDETSLEVAIGTLGLTLGLGSVWPADLRAEAVRVGQHLNAWMPAMQPLAIGFALGNDRTSVVEQRLLGDFPEIGERLAQAGQPGLAVLALGSVRSTPGL
jgi:hypothetical protein